MKLSIFGIRHHGCGSARSLRRALESMRPDIILIEGAPEADELIELAAHEEMRPPVALLIYAPDDPKKAVYYPFAEFSPEWQAIKYGLAAEKPVRFIDLPQSHQLEAGAEPKSNTDEKPAAAIDENPNADGEPTSNDDEQTPSPHEFSPEDLPEIPSENSTETSFETQSDLQSQIKNQKSQIRRDPLQFAAEAAGFEDGELWWENLVETRRGHEDELFEGILELMSSLREEAEKEAADSESERDELREAYMREQIRRAADEGYENIAVVCGAWHAPALAALDAYKNDRKKLSKLSKTKLSATWIPYTYNRLAAASGYGAGITSPEFYHQIWNAPDKTASRWLARVAALLREQDLDASSASVIEAVRLAESLAVVRGLSGVGLNELFDAVRAVLCFGDDAPLNLIGEKLIVGERIGQVPSVTSAVPLQRDLQAAQKRLRLPPEAAHKSLELDLRKPNDLERSQLLHRLELLEINWGVPQRTSGKGTFKEAWRLVWEPEMEIALIEANVWGNTIASAAANKVRKIAAEAEKLSDLTEIVEKTLLADLPDAVDFLMRELEAKTAVSSDVPAMMDALAPLADVLRYGNVRRTDAAAVRQVVDGLTARICINLKNACAALDDDAADQMHARIVKTDGAIALLQDEKYLSEWYGALRKLADSEKINGLVTGRAARILFDKKRFSPEETARRINLALSLHAPEAAAAWLEGFLRGSGLILLHNETLLKILDDWIKVIKEDVFIQILPLLRRTFATFHAPERRRIGERLKRGAAAGGVSQISENEDDEIDRTRAAVVLPLVRLLLGTQVTQEEIL